MPWESILIRRGLVSGSGGALYALTKTGEVVESTNNGASWMSKSVITVPDAVSIRHLKNVLYVLTGSGFVFRSSDAAISWLPVGTLSQVGMAGLTYTSEGLVAATQEGLVAKSADGSRWNWVGGTNQIKLQALGNDTPSTPTIGAQQITWSEAKERYRRQ